MLSVWKARYVTSAECDCAGSLFNFGGKVGGPELTAGGDCAAPLPPGPQEAVRHPRVSPHPRMITQVLLLSFLSCLTAIPLPPFIHDPAMVQDMPSVAVPQHLSFWIIV